MPLVTNKVLKDPLIKITKDHYYHPKQNKKENCEHLSKLSLCPKNYEILKELWKNL